MSELSGGHHASDRIWVEIDAGGSSIAGAVHRGSDPVRQFSGWLELVALLDATCHPDGRIGGEGASAGRRP
jgi:hypothetical protein